MWCLLQLLTLTLQESGWLHRVILGRGRLRTNPSSSTWKAGGSYPEEAGQSLRYAGLSRAGMELFLTLGFFFQSFFSNAVHINHPLISPLMSLCTIMLLWRYETPSRIWRVYFRVTFSVRAPYAFSWSFTDPWPKANGTDQQRKDKPQISQSPFNSCEPWLCYARNRQSNEFWPLLKPFCEALRASCPMKPLLRN